MEISVIASGSNGNSTLIEDKDSKILVDAGKSCSEIESRLGRLGKDLDGLNGVLLTHSHTDHFASVGVVCRKYNVPLYLIRQVYGLVSSRIGDVDVKHFSLGKDFMVGGLSVKPVKTSHDVPSCGFVFKDFGLFTDTGIVTRQMDVAVKKLKSVLLESNHDIDMLLNGPYPYFLKNRILSDTGHLSNVVASTFVKDKGRNLNLVLLGHLSGNNNTVDLAKKTFETLVNKRVDYSVLDRDKESGKWVV